MTIEEINMTFFDFIKLITQEQLEIVGEKYTYTFSLLGEGSFNSAYQLEKNFTNKLENYPTALLSNKTSTSDELEVGKKYVVTYSHH